MSEGLRLTIELVPRTSWCDNMRTVVTRQTWDQIRRAVYREYDYRCGICGARGRLTCHERWAYDDERQVQTLLGFIALCELCHHVKHIGLAGILARKGQLDYDEVVQHFMAVNDCDESTFEEHRAQAFAVWQRRSTHPWTVDLGRWAAVVREKGNGEEGRLGCASKAATARHNPRAIDPEKKLICVYTYDGDDRDDVGRVLRELRTLGFGGRLFWKADSATLAGLYSGSGRRVSRYSSDDF